MANEEPLDKDFIIAQLQQLVVDQAKVIEGLKTQIVELKDALQQLKHPKNSSTSSIPPSKDENRKTKSLRGKSGKKSGGQPGHKGSTLQMVSVADTVIKHAPNFCGSCRKDLSGVAEELLQRRQVVDLPVVKPIYTEHQCYGKTCSCGHVNKSDFPANVNAPVQYGPHLEATIAYLSTRQYMPYNRIGEYLKDAFQLPISEGSVENILNRFAHKAEVVYRQIWENISAATTVGADETGAKVDGAKAWVHTWQDSFNTYLAISKSRGKKAIGDNFPHGFPSATLVSDAWAAQLATVAKYHQLCCAHLLRELNHFMEIYKDSWPGQAKAILIEAIGLRSKMEEGQFKGDCAERDALEKRMDELLANPPDMQYKKMKPFHKRLVKNRGYLFRFLYDAQVPPDNNGSERAIRNVKVKQKVSGQFKSFKGAEVFTIIRSLIDTAIKRKRNVFHCLNLTAMLVPE